MKPFFLIVGAGPAGIGMGILLKQLGVENFGILERDRIGSSFRQWTKEMRFIWGTHARNTISLPAAPFYAKPSTIGVAEG
ncbi:NAD(P)-binding domain-containing protein [Parageobacillus sp. KH3-4]|uniref:NAD(P)-binding domain-containing protein n=1 Tax=Parageobacillus sp. KH3-4 TaxID=2916802 RepID=UPI00206A72F0|nr:NAD(P)-binding domain-containing protein [Parageobacillus sp. KH3-4]BDG47721.1 hypothetical protein PspKH34_22820 [Parageobacillus sp. KH3-4]